MRAFQFHGHLESGSGFLIMPYKRCAACAGKSNSFTANSSKPPASRKTSAARRVSSAITSPAPARLAPPDRPRSQNPTERIPHHAWTARQLPPSAAQISPRQDAVCVSPINDCPPKGRDTNYRYRFWAALATPFNPRSLESASSTVFSQLGAKILVDRLFLEITSTSLFVFFSTPLT